MERGLEVRRRGAVAGGRRGADMINGAVGMKTAPLGMAWVREVMDVLRVGGLNGMVRLRRSGCCDWRSGDFGYGFGCGAGVKRNGSWKMALRKASGRCLIGNGAVAGGSDAPQCVGFAGDRQAEYTETRRGVYMAGKGKKGVFKIS